MSKAEAEVWATAAMELWRWVYGGGKVLPGLVFKRVAEAKLLDQ
ncbi:glycoside hydrolase family protein [Marinobacter sp. AL4B]